MISDVGVAFGIPNRCRGVRLPALDLRRGGFDDFGLYCGLSGRTVDVILRVERLKEDLNKLLRLLLEEHLHLGLHRLLELILRLVLLDQGQYVLGQGGRIGITAAKKTELKTPIESLTLRVRLTGVRGKL